MAPSAGRIGESPQANARITGFLWLTCIVTGIIAYLAESGITVRSDAAVTATNIMAHQTLFRLGFAANLVSGMSYVGVTALLYYLMKPVGRSISAFAAFFGLVGLAVGAIAWLMQIAPVLLLNGDRYLGAFTIGQLHAIVMLTFRLRTQVFSIGMAFFGVQCVFVGYLITRSTFLPRTLGVLLAVGGASYVLVSFASFLAPSLGSVTPFFMPIALVGEGSLTAWLLVKGVNVEEWMKQASGKESIGGAQVTHGVLAHAAN